LEAEAATAASAASRAPDWDVWVPAVTGLIGVLVGGFTQIGSAFLVAWQQRHHRLVDERAERERAQAAVDAERQYARAILARHLEAYARSCAHTMWCNDDPEEEGAMAIPDFPDWPRDVSWELLGAREMMEVRDIEVRVDLRQEQTAGAIHHGAATEQDARDYYRDSAARIGLEAWRVSEKLRTQAGVVPFEFPTGGSNFAEALAQHVAKLDEVVREWEERRRARAAAGQDDDLL